MTQTRARIVAISLLALAGCQSPGSFSGLFGSKDGTAADSRAAAAGDADAKATKNPLFAWNRKPAAAPQPAGRQRTENDTSFGRDPIEGEMQRAQQAQSDGRLTAAQSGYQKVLQLQPDNVQAHQGLAVILDQQGSFREAERHYLHALQITPRDPDLLSNLGYSYSMQERYPEAEQTLQTALEIEPRHRTALFNLGAVFAKQGRFDQALAVFREGGSEQQAQAALAQFTSPAHGASGPGAQVAAANSNHSSPPPEDMSPATRKLWEDIQKERKADEQRRLAIRKKQGPGSRISAPNPGPREAQGFQAPPPGALTAEQRRQRALEYLNTGRRNPSELNQLFNQIDQNAVREQALADAYHAPNPGQNYGSGGWGQSQAPAGGGMHPQNSLAASGAHSPADSNWMRNPNPPAQGGVGGWNSLDPSSARQFAEGSGMPEWSPLATEGSGGTGLSAQTVSASRPISAPPTRPRITPGNSPPNPTSASGAWSGGTTSHPDPLPTGNLPPWTPGLQPSSGAPSPAPWQGNSLPLPAGGAQDDFVPIPGQGSGVSGNGRPQTSASPTVHFQIQQVSAVQPAPFTQTGPQGMSSAAPRNAWEQARLEAAQMGLNAGPGSMFPVSQPGGAEGASQPPQGANPTYPGANGWSTQPNPGYRQGPQHREMNRASVPAAAIPSAQGMSYGEPGLLDTSRAQLLQSAATETSRRQLEYQRQVTRQTQVPSLAEQQRTANLWPSSPAGGATGPQRLPVSALPADGGFPGQP